jgi:hypothetical protein
MTSQIIQKTYQVTVIHPDRDTRELTVADVEAAIVSHLYKTIGTDADVWIVQVKE